VALEHLRMHKILDGHVKIVTCSKLQSWKIRVTLLIFLLNACTKS